MNRKHSFEEKEFYHVYNRGVNKNIIFKDGSDYYRFLELLYLANSESPVDLRELLHIHKGRTFVDILNIKRKKTIVEIGALCLMNNHFHLLISQKVKNGISKFMQKLITGYVMYFNKKYDRVGPLFQGKFKSKHIIDDNHLQYLFSYIHLQPIKIKKVSWDEISTEEIKKEFYRALKYPYSSIRVYLEKQDPLSNILETENIPWKFNGAKEGEQELLSWIHKNPEVE